MRVRWQRISNGFRSIPGSLCSDRGSVSANQPMNNRQGPIRRPEKLPLLDAICKKLNQRVNFEDEQRVLGVWSLNRSMVPVQALYHCRVVAMHHCIIADHVVNLFLRIRLDHIPVGSGADCPLNAIN